jgi:hypothetical protein
LTHAQCLRRQDTPHGTIAAITRWTVVALKEAGVERINKQTASGGRWDRPELHRLLETVRPGDVAVVRKLSAGLIRLLHRVISFALQSAATTCIC